MAIGGKLMRFEKKDIFIDEQLELDLKRAARDAAIEYKDITTLESWVEQLIGYHKKLAGGKGGIQGRQALHYAKELTNNIEKLILSLTREEWQEHALVKKARVLIKKSKSIIAKEEVATRIYE